MAYYPKKRSTGRRMRKRVAARKRKGVKVSRKFTKMVRKVFFKTVENKLITSGITAGLYPVGAGGNFIANNIFPLSPHTEATYPAGAQLIAAQGTGDGQRIGNRIRTARCHMKGVIWPNPYNASTNTLNAPIEVVMWILRLKPGFADTYSQVNTIMTNSLFKVGGTASGITNTMTDLTLPINTDTVILKKKRVFKIGNSSQVAAVGSTNANLYSNNDFKLNQKFSIDLTRIVNKVVSYKDTDNNPTSRTTWCVMTFVAADNSAPLITNIPASFNYFVEYQYDDA